jgi:hypothetical protein
MLALPLKMTRPFCRTAKSPVLKKPSESNFWAVSSGACRYLLHCQQAKHHITSEADMPQEKRRCLDQDLALLALGQFDNNTR